MICIYHFWGVKAIAQKIKVLNERREKLGETFPRRAKQLISKNRAKWADETHREIIMTAEEGGMMMNGDNAVLTEAKRKKSIVMDAYRDSEAVVLSSTPLEIIKKSKRRTRELHAAFSAVLWVGALILYFTLSYAMGYRDFTPNPTQISWTWLVFFIAAIIECLAEIYFCKKELGVLNENIDLRQVNPSKGGELDLWGYQKRLTKKIKLMSSAVLWIPLILVYFVCGYAFGLWNTAWIVFVFGAFLELLRSFMGKLRAKAD